MSFPFGNGKFRVPTFSSVKGLGRGDIDGFFGLALDNLVQLLLIDNLCRYVLGFPTDFVRTVVLPGAAVSILAGNLFYAWQARELGRRTGRDDVCALPYGINTVSLFGHVFLVMLPVKLAAGSAPDAWRLAWYAGIAATVGSAVIELAAAFVAEKIRRATPRAALLSTLAGIALAFISLGFLLRTYARPETGIVTLSVILLTYFGRIRFRGGIPGGLVAVVLGTVLAWTTGIAGSGARPPFEGLSPVLPYPHLLDFFRSLRLSFWLPYVSVILPMGLFNVLGSLQNIESAESAGDAYRTRPSLLANGAGSLVAALFGSPFPTTIYIGHPGWKAMGARTGYSVLNGVFITALALSGTLGLVVWAVPIDAGMAIVLWIGIVITAQSFQAVPRSHAPAAVIGLLPALAAWGALLAKNSLRAAGMGTPAAPFTPSLIDAFLGSGTWIHGAFALEQGFIATSMGLAAATVHIIERKFRLASLWFLGLAVLSLTGLVHSYRFAPDDTVGSLTPAWPWFWGYLGSAALLAVAPWITEDAAGH